jgi:hypothetical protein
MAKVKDLNFLLELAQKNLHAIKKGTIERYKKQLSILLNTESKIGHLWQYQEGMAETVENLKRFKDGEFDGIVELAKYRVEEFGRIATTGELVYAKNTFSGGPGEIGKKLICNELLKTGDLWRDDFAYCEYCGALYAVKTKKSRYCTQTCHVLHNRAIKLKPQEE